MDEPCADCGKKIQVLWCQLWDKYLCTFCKSNRTIQELAITTMANAQAARGASTT